MMLGENRPNTLPREGRTATARRPPGVPARFSAGTAHAQQPSRRLQAMVKAYPPEDLARRVFLLLISGITLQIAAIVFLLLI